MTRLTNDGFVTDRLATPTHRGAIWSSMRRSPHTFHIPVMGTGFTLDTPIRVARYGISSVMSLVDDVLVERLRKHYCALEDLEYEPIAHLAPDARARRIQAWCDLVHHSISRQMDEIRVQPFKPGSDKTKYFELLPGDSPLRCEYNRMLAMPAGIPREIAAAALGGHMVAGCADVNIMTKLDRARFDRDGKPLGTEFADAKAALRGFAASRLESCLVLSAGMNPTLFGLLETLPGFYRDADGHVRKGIVLKVSDFRSALVQGKFLAKKGIEIREIRVESGLNCGGHAFATEGELLGPILEEIRSRRDELEETLMPPIRRYYEAEGRPWVGEARRIRVTVQGGIGTAGEVARLREHYGVDGVGWATPFLLVPEATALDAATRQLLAEAGPADLYVSDVSPLERIRQPIEGKAVAEAANAAVGGLAQQNDDAGELGEAQEVAGVSLVTGDELPEAQHPGEETLDVPASAVAA